MEIYKCIMIPTHGSAALPKTLNPKMPTTSRGGHLDSQSVQLLVKPKKGNEERQQ